MHNFKDLKVWQKSIELASEIYEVLSGFPSDEKMENFAIKISEIQKMIYMLERSINT